MISERIEASCTCRFCQACSYHRHEKPSQMAIETPELKE
jgi:hypothetical protein